MKKTRHNLMAIGVLALSLSAAVFGHIKGKTVSAQLNSKAAVPIQESWADDKHIFSSFNDQKALSVDASYGFKIHKTSQTQTIITKGKETAKRADDNMPDFLRKYIWFDTSENKAGDIQVKKTNMEIYQCEKDGSNGHWEKLDIVMTITGIEKYKGRDGYVAIGSGINGCSYIGIEEMTMKSQFFKAGTNIPVTIKSNMTLNDIDAHQYIGVKVDNIHGEYVSKNTRLSYKKDGNTSIYYADFPDNCSGEDFSSAGFTFTSDTFEYSFGRILDKGPTSRVQCVGYGQNMVKFDAPAPRKEIVTSKGAASTKYTGTDLSEAWTYEISQAIAGEIPEAHYFKNFIFEDQIESCLKILDAKVFGDNKDVSNEFDISQTGHIIRAKLKNPSDAAFYKRGVYTLKIKVRMDVMQDATKEQMDELRMIWDKHGHYNAEKTVITENNSAMVVVDGKNTMTNEARVDIELPKKDEKNPGLFIKKETSQYEYQAKDEITYKVTVKNKNAKAKTAYFVIQDRSLIDVSGVSLKNIKVSGIPENAYSLERTGNGWTLRSKGDYALPYDDTIEISYTVAVSAASNGKLINNEASTWAAGIPETKDQAEVYINSPKNMVIKSAPAQIYKKGDHVAYKAVLMNHNPGTFMRDIQIEDEIAAEGMKILPGTLSIMADGKNITSKCQITFDKNGRSYVALTPVALKNGTIPAITSECGKATKNYDNLWMTDKIEISYQAVIEEDGLEGKDIKNVMKIPATKNTNKELIKEDDSIPSGSGMAEEIIKIKAPKLQILKQSDKKIYSVGETGIYKLHIIQGKEGVSAKNVTITDEFDKEGMKITDIQVLYNKQDITEECKIDASDHQFLIQTGKELGDNDTLDVIYKVFFEKRIDGAVKNTAIAESDNTTPDRSENTVVVKPPMLKIEKTSQRKVYKEGQTGSYTICVTQKNEGMTAHNVIIEDFFEKKGMEISTIRVKYNGEDITAQCEIMKDDSLRKFKINTGKDLSDQDQITVNYDVKFDNMIQGDIKNTALSYSEDADKVRDDHVVTMEQTTPKLLITKKSDKTLYKAGDICEYQINVSQIVKDAIAKYLVIEDEIDKEGAQIVEKSIHVYAPDESDITSKCKIMVSGNSYRIETGRTLRYDETIKVIYEVKLKDKLLAGKTIKNTAKANAQNAKQVTAIRQIKVKEEKLTISKNNQNIQRKIPGKTTYTSSAKTGDQTDLRWIIVLMAAFVTGSFIWFKKKKH